MLAIPVKKPFQQLPVTQVHIGRKLSRLRRSSAAGHPSGDHQLALRQRRRGQLIRQAVEVISADAKAQRQLGDFLRSAHGVVLARAVRSGELVNALGKFLPGHAGLDPQLLHPLAEGRNHHLVVQPWVLRRRIQRRFFRLLHRLFLHILAGRRAGVPVQTGQAAVGAVPLAVSVVMIVHPLRILAHPAGVLTLPARHCVASGKLPHLVDGAAPSLVDDPVQQPVLLVDVHPGDLQGRCLWDLVPLPAFHQSRHFQAVLDGRQVGDFGGFDLQGLRHIVPDAPRKLLTGLPALDVGLRQTLRLIGQQGIGLHPLAVGLDHRRLLLPLRHRRQHPAQDLGKARPVLLGAVLPHAPDRSQTAVAGDQAIGAVTGRDHRGRLQKAVGPDGVRQCPQRLRVRRWVEVPGVVPDIVNRDLHHGVRHAGQLLTQHIHHVKFPFFHPQHLPEISFTSSA